MTDARNDSDKKAEKAATAKRLFAAAISEFLRTENEFVSNMQITSAALSGTTELDKKHLQAAYSGRGNVNELVADLQQKVGLLKEADYLQVNNENPEVVALDPDAFDRHLKAMVELALQSTAVNGRNDNFNTKLRFLSKICGSAAAP